MIKRVRQVGVGAAGVAVLALAGGIAIGAGGGARLETTAFSIPAFEQGSDSVRCTGRRRALGGGVVQSGTPDGLRLMGSAPLIRSGSFRRTGSGDVAKRWEARVDNGNGTQEANLKVAVICSRRSDARLKVKPLILEPDASEGTVLRCRRGTFAVGGGVLGADPSGFPRVAASGPLDKSGTVAGSDDGDRPRRWFVAAESTDDQDLTRLKAFANCARKPKPRILESEITIPTGTVGEESVPCPGRKRALGGGVIPDGDTEDVVVLSNGPLDSTGITAETNDGDKAKRWYAAMLNVGAELDVKVLAVCG